MKNPEQLVLFDGPRNHYGNNSGGNMLWFPMHEDFRDNFVDRAGARALPCVSLPVADDAPAAPIFSGMFSRRAVAMNVGVNGQTERVPGELVSGTYFQVLGVGAAIGRAIMPDDDKRGDGPVAVLSYGVRLALGASRGRIVSQLLVESGMLAAVGGVPGLVIAAWTTKFLLGFLPTTDTPHVISGSIDYRILISALFILRGGHFYRPGTGMEDGWRKAARDGTLRIPGDGAARISLIHVADVARAVLLATESAAGGSICNVVDDQPVTYAELYRWVAAQIGAPDPTLGDPTLRPSLACSNARIKRELGWSPTHPTYRAGLA